MEGRILIIVCTVNNIELTICNIYMPTQSNEQKQLKTLEELDDLLRSNTNKKYIIGGDFNLHLNPVLDSGN